MKAAIDLPAGYDVSASDGSSGGAQEPAPTSDDSELVRALARDLNGAFEQVVITFGSRLFRFALRLTGSREDAEEIAQDAFVRAYRALQGYDAGRIRALALQAWLYRITLNLARNRRRRRRPELVVLDGDSLDEREHQRPERLAEDAERRRELAALLLALPVRHRAPVVLRHVEGLSYREIATILDQPEGTVKANVHRGITQLRKSMTEETT